MNFQQSFDSCSEFSSRKRSNTPLIFLCFTPQTKLPHPIKTFLSFLQGKVFSSINNHIYTKKTEESPPRLVWSFLSCIEPRIIPKTHSTPACFVIPGLSAGSIGNQGQERNGMSGHGLPRQGIMISSAGGYYPPCPGPFIWVTPCLITPGSHMIQSPGKFDAKWPGHRKDLYGKNTKIKRAVAQIPSYSLVISK